MIITFVNTINMQSIDIKLDNMQIIEDTLKILQDTGSFQKNVDINCLEIVSARTKKILDISKNFEDEKIYNADILYIRQVENYEKS